MSRWIACSLALITLTGSPLRAEGKFDDTYAGDAPTTVSGMHIRNIFLFTVKGRHLTGTFSAAGVGRLPVRGSVSNSGRFRGTIPMDDGTTGAFAGRIHEDRLIGRGKLEIPDRGVAPFTLESETTNKVVPGFAGELRALSRDPNVRPDMLHTFVKKLSSTATEDTYECATNMRLGPNPSLVHRVKVTVNRNASTMSYGGTIKSDFRPPTPDFIYTVTITRSDSSFRTTLIINGTCNFGGALITYSGFLYY
ncbi:MAG: hypothetical protein ACREKL_12125 [Chthoniobacterales bacterium]